MEKKRLSLSLGVGLFLLGLVLLRVLLRGGPWDGEVHTMSRSGISMNTAIRITVSGGDKRELDNVLDEAFRLLNVLNGQLSLFQEDSAVARINGSAGGEPETVSPDVFAVIDTALRICGLTGGAFNPLVGPLTKLWKINRQPFSDAESADLHARMRFRLPEAASIDALLPLTRIDNLETQLPDRKSVV